MSREDDRHAGIAQQFAEEGVPAEYDEQEEPKDGRRQDHRQREQDVEHPGEPSPDVKAQAGGQGPQRKYDGCGEDRGAEGYPKRSVVKHRSFSHQRTVKPYLANT